LKCWTAVCLLEISAGWQKKHTEKIHFVPIRYRIVGAILQGLNIKFGNFIEQLLKNIVESDTGVKVLEDSGKKIKLFFTLR
jgi:hypothetical protein